MFGMEIAVRLGLYTAGLSDILDDCIVNMFHENGYGTGLEL